MNWKVMASAGLCVLSVVVMAWMPQTQMLPDEAGVQLLRERLGAQKLPHQIEVTPELVERGRQLFHEGRTEYQGQKSKYISIHFTCGDCHNTEPEFELTTQHSAADRLAYAKKNNLPYLPASTFYGIVNRDSWYNGDYITKYGDLATKAQFDLKEAIQLCAKECSQGRYLKDWEMDAMIAYSWSLEVKVGDLNLDWDALHAQKQKNLGAALSYVDERLPKASFASFVNVPNDKKKGYPVEYDLSDGQYIYENSCGHCHKPDGPSDFVLDDAKDTYRFMDRKVDSHGDLSIYQIARWGTSPSDGRRAYMPQYSKEKMSDAQLESLRRYIESKAK